jgi:hypothetical protein
MKVQRFAVALLSAGLVAHAQEPVKAQAADSTKSAASIAGAAANPAPSVKTVSPETGGRLQRTITVVAPGLMAYLEADKIARPAFVLYLDGTPFPDLAVSGPTPGQDEIRFFLDRNAANEKQWTALLRNPKPFRDMPLTVGIDKGASVPIEVLPSEVGKFRLTIYDPGILFAGGISFLVLVGLFVWMANKSDVMRESGPPPRPAGFGLAVPRRAYSLSRVQMAVWFFLVAAAFLFIWGITFALDSIIPSVLALIGISAGTGLAATVVDSSKTASISAQRDQLVAEDEGLAAALTAFAAKPQPLDVDDTGKQQLAVNRRAAIAGEIADIDKQIDAPAHESFLIDILSDANGISFHRFQMAAWTLILAIVFVISVWNNLAMPDFGATLLGLMGISSGTYIGFKFPEVKN